MSYENQNRFSVLQEIDDRVNDADRQGEFNQDVSAEPNEVEELTGGIHEMFVMPP